MAYCSRCGVEVDEYTDYCPLCEAPIQRFDEHGEPRLPAYPQEDRERPEDRSERTRIRRMIALQIISTVVATPLVVVLATDLLLGRHVTWSGYVVASLVAAWAYAAVPLLAPRRPGLILLIDVGVTAGYLAALDLFSGALEWFVPLGVPLIGAVAVVAVAIWFLSVRSRRLGANLAGFIVVGIAVICVITETVVEAYLETSIALDWSLIVAVAILPIAAFTFYLHYVLSKRVDFKRHFHV